MTYQGRRAPNVSEYIANLNSIPSAQDLQSLDQDNFNFDGDLALFTNANFFDLGAFDQGPEAELPGTNYSTEGLGGQSDVGGDAVDMKAMEFGAGEFSFSDFNNFSAPEFTRSLSVSIPPPIQTSKQYPSSSAAGSPTTALSTPTSGTKRKAESISKGSPASEETFEDASRLAAEEDKRRRNTAASARFRVKKKQREQALERSAKEMSDKVSALEGRINQLETENKWLKNLITEKNETNEDIAVLWKKYNAENEGSKGTASKKGVGTQAESEE